jgi:hypothetical protein
MARYDFRPRPWVGNLPGRLLSRPAREMLAEMFAERPLASDSKRNQHVPTGQATSGEVDCRACQATAVLPVASPHNSLSAVH